MMEMGLIRVPNSTETTTTITIPTTSPRAKAPATAAKSGTKDEKPANSWLTPEGLLCIIICITMLGVVLDDEL